MNDDSELIAGNTCTLADYRATHFQWRVADRVGTVTLNRPERKNPLTFASYAELRDLFARLRYASDVKSIVIHGAGDNFCSGGDVHEIIGPLTYMDAPGLLAFTRMTSDLVLAMRRCPQPIVAAVDDSPSSDATLSNWIAARKKTRSAVSRITQNSHLLFFSASVKTYSVKQKNASASAGARTNRLPSLTPAAVRSWR